MIAHNLFTTNLYQLVDIEVIKKEKKKSVLQYLASSGALHANICSLPVCTDIRVASGNHAKRWRTYTCRQLSEFKAHNIQSNISVQKGLLDLNSCLVFVKLVLQLPFPSEWMVSAHISQGCILLY